jgi:cell division protein FtsB
MRTSPIPVSSRRYQLARAFWIACAVLYALLSMLDLFLTWLLVDGVRGTYEANPLAADILENHGWAGVALFKGGCVAIVLATGALLWRRRPRTARVILGLACSCALGVVGYSLWLTDSGVEAAGWGRQLAHARSQARQYSELRQAQHAYHQRVDKLARDIAHERTTLTAAVSEICVLLEELNYDPVRYFTHFYGRLPREAALAAHLVRKVGFEVCGDAALARRQLQNLSREFAVYQTPLPRVSSDAFALTASKTPPTRRGAAN